MKQIIDRYHCSLCGTKAEFTTQSRDPDDLGWLAITIIARAHVSLSSGECDVPETIHLCPSCAQILGHQIYPRDAEILLDSIRESLELEVKRRQQLQQPMAPRDDGNIGAMGSGPDSFGH